MTHMATLPVEIRHFHMFGAIGGGAKGFNKGQARVGNLEARFRCIGSIDVDVAANRDFLKLVGVPATTMDLFDRAQYVAFHGKEPPAGWREATPADIQIAAGGERPHIVFLSAPCKGFSGLLSESRSKTEKYQALNRLTLRGIWLMLEAWADDPPELVIFENVPRIATRGRHLLNQIVALLRQYGYATAETTHDCGEIGGLAQSRKRFLLVARHAEKVPPFLYEPSKKSLRAVGDVLGRMPLPGDATGGPMHRLPELQWKTWVRLAFVEAGSDWRSLQKLQVADGVLTDFTIVPERAYRNGYCGVRHWNQPSVTVAGGSRPLNGAFSIADPRYNGKEYSQYGVLPWNDSMGAVSAQSMPGGGKYAVADPRTASECHGNVYRVVDWNQHGGTVNADFKATSGGGVADPRHMGPAKHSNEYRVAPWDDAAQAVTSAHGTGQCVADPRPVWSKDAHGSKLALMRYDEPARTVTGARFGSGALCVADPRESAACAFSQTADSEPLPAERDHLVARIIALDGTYHRPFTTLELAALQSLIDPEEQLQLDGLSDQNWRERIGNAVPSAAATEIANVMGTTLLLAWSGETFMLSSQAIWVRPVAIALSLAQGDLQ